MKAHIRSVVLVVPALAVSCTTLISQMPNVQAARQPIQSLQKNIRARAPLSGHDTPVVPQTAILRLVGVPLPVLWAPATPSRASVEPVASGAPSAVGSVLVPPKLDTVHQHITVTPANDDPDSPDHVIVTSQTRSEIRSAAGAYSDVPRYLQMLPGVAFDNDARNSFLVRGGNPSENLFVIDGFEVPNINHLSTLTSTGGFVSMVDTEALNRVTLHTGARSSMYAERLSSVLDMQTREIDHNRPHLHVDLGYAGVGVIATRPIGHRGGMMTSLRRSVVNMVTNDIGIDGVPVYASSLSTFDYMISSKDKLAGLFLGGMDSISIRPNIHDSQDPLYANADYSGIKYTAGTSWQHALSLTSFGTASFTQSRQHIVDNQTNALMGNTPVYSDNLVDGTSALKYDLYLSNGVSLQARFGASLGLDSINYNVNQYGGLPNPYSDNPKPMDALRFAPDTKAINQAYYGEFTWNPNEDFVISGGARFQKWGLNGSSSLNPHINITARASDKVYFYVGFATFSQLPPYLYMLATPGNRYLTPMKTTNSDYGFIVRNASGDRLIMNAYIKLYTGYPVSTQFPNLTLANVADTFTTPFMYFPMVSSGIGNSTGLEFSVETSYRRPAFIQGSFTMSTTSYAALDGKLSPGSFDYPYMGTIAGGFHLGARNFMTLRYSSHSGAPYTPMQVDLSIKQDRPVFQSGPLNQDRGPTYARMDLRLERTFRAESRQIKLYAGCENILDRRNFYQYVFVPNSKLVNYELTQMGRYPDAGIIVNF